MSGQIVATLPSHSGCLVTTEHKVKDYGRNSICCIRAPISRKLQTQFEHFYK